MADAKTPNSSINLPYINAYGGIKKVLDRIIEAATPDRFTQDFLATKLGLKGGSATPLIPFLKRTGFLKSDGSPTELYNKFRNPSFRKSAAAKSVKDGYRALYEINEYAHSLSDADLLGAVVQATGLDSKSTTVRAIVGSFKALRSFADFDAAIEKADEQPEEKPEGSPESNGSSGKSLGGPVNLKLGYTINLNLPATSDIAVFNAIFKSLKDHLLEE